MLRYGALLAAAAFAAVPAQAQQMNAREARAFVVGKLFSYQCFEGTRGAGRIMENGAVAGTIQFRGNGATRYAVLPANTLHVIGDRVCATVRGVPFRPCFNLIKTSASTFRGSVSGLGFAYCDFVRRDRPVVASVEQPGSRPAKPSAPMDLKANTTASAAFPKPIEKDDLPAVEEKPAEEVAAEAKADEAKPDDAAAGAADEKPALRSTKD
ncbi:MAG: hypothetical protein AB7V13_22630 [Pseudorhodoplanes sp.]|uniref:hypothetical protein n=1 Tax=Pseudorhodoplanes sp. TaxID=1934341 RepID=UPI003D1283AE